LSLQVPFAPRSNALDPDDRACLKPQLAIAMPFSELTAKTDKRPPLGWVGGRVLQAINDRELEIRHPTSGLQRQECTVAIERDDVDARETFED
jgi:hypothetical protein